MKHEDSTPKDAEAPRSGGIRSLIKALVERAIRFQVIAQSNVNRQTEAAFAQIEQRLALIEAERSSVVASQSNSDRQTEATLAQMDRRLASIEVERATILSDYVAQSNVNRQAEAAFLQIDRRLTSIESKRAAAVVAADEVDRAVSAVSALHMGIASVMSDVTVLQERVNAFGIHVTRADRFAARMVAFRRAVIDERRRAVDLQAAIESLGARLTALQRQEGARHEEFREARIGFRASEEVVRGIASSFRAVDADWSSIAGETMHTIHAPSLIRLIGPPKDDIETLEHDDQLGGVSAASMGGMAQGARIVGELLRRVEFLERYLKDVAADASRALEIVPRVDFLEVNAKEIAADVLRASELAPRVDFLEVYAKEIAADVSRASELAPRVAGLECYAKDIAADAARAIVTGERVAHRVDALPYTSQAPSTYAGATRSTADGFDYVGFEAVFRGSEELVCERQRVYADFFRGRRHVLDLGCGRGEFLQVMRDLGIDATGIDLNPAMVARCREKGFPNVWEADAVAWLAETDAAGFDGIFTAQFIEHISFDDLVRLTATAYSHLFSGGVFIAETVNPQSIDAFKTFYVDPSHVRPLFPEVVAFLCRSVGFRDVNIFFPNGGGFAEADPASQNEYAVVAYK